MNVLPLRVAEWITTDPVTAARVGWVLFGVGVLLAVIAVGLQMTGEPRPSRRQRRKERGLVRQAELICAHAARNPANDDD